MKVILKQRIEKVGKAWDLVNVKDGFARNFLFPKDLALEATKSNLTLRQSRMALKEAELLKEKANAQDLAKKLQNASFTLPAEANVDDKLYGSVDREEIVKLLDEEGYAIEKKNILLDEPIKSLGVYEIAIHIHPEVSTKIKLWIVKK